MRSFFHNVVNKAIGFLYHILGFFAGVIGEIVAFMKKEIDGMTRGQRIAFYVTMAILAMVAWFCLTSAKITWVAFESGLAFLFTYLVYARVERCNRRVAIHNATPGAAPIGNCSIREAVTYTLRAHLYWLAPVAGLCLYI